MKTMYYNFLYATDVEKVLNSVNSNHRIYYGADRYERLSDDMYEKYVAGYNVGNVSKEYVIKKLTLSEFTVELPV